MSIEFRALVPLRSPTQGKLRLAASLRAVQRARLIDTMLHDVLAALRATPGCREIHVVAREASRMPRDVLVHRERAPGLNAALRGTLEDLAALDDRPVLIVAADLPLLTTRDVTRLVEAGRTASVVVAPDRQREGTNALWLRAPAGFVPRFGERSAREHLADATRLGSSVSLCETAGLGFDVDTEADLRSLQRLALSHYAFLSEPLAVAAS